MSTGRRLGRAELEQRLRTLITVGRIGLPRLGRAFTGGPKIAAKNNMIEFGLYFSKRFVPWFTEHFGEQALASKTLILDNASYHGALRTNDDSKVSFIHSWATDVWGMKGTVFLPPLSPYLNPAENSFSFTKQFIRHQAPPQGFSADEFPSIIRSAFHRLNTETIAGFFKGCGYEFTPSPEKYVKWLANSKTIQERKAQIAPLCALDDTELQTLAQQNPQILKQRAICATPEGLIVKEKRPNAKTFELKVDSPRAAQYESKDLQDIFSGNFPRKSLLPPIGGARLPLRDARSGSLPAVPDNKRQSARLRAKAPPPPPPVKHRYVGLGPAPSDLPETEPEVFFRQVLGRPGHEDVFEPERIVAYGDDNTGHPLYRTRWVGYESKDDTWEPEDAFFASKVLMDDAKRRIKAGTLTKVNQVVKVGQVESG